MDAQQAAIAKGMLNRGDHQHHIAAYFGENPGRIAEIKKGDKFKEVKAALVSELPPVRQARFIDPNAPAETQYSQLRGFIQQPPENSRIVVFSPALAELILNRLNEKNRKKRPGNIKKFAAAMTADNWVLTGDTIKFSLSGWLSDGQNRLSGCVRSGTMFKTHVVFGIPDDAFSRIDAGATRTNPDTLQIAGVRYYAIVAPAVRWIMIGTDRGRKVENDEILNYYRSNIDSDRMDSAAKTAAAVGRALPSGALAAHLYLFDEKNERLAAKFSSDLIQQRGGARKLLQKVDRLRKANMGRLNELQVNALIIQAWNAYRAGKPITAAMLSWDENKEYPAIA